MPVGYRKGFEQGLWYTIKCFEDIIKGKESRGEDCKFEKGLLKSYRKYTEEQYQKALSAKLPNPNLTG